MASTMHERSEDSAATSVNAAQTDGPYDAEYYRSGLGPHPYERNDLWLGHFNGVADAIVRAFSPATVLDVGCAYGMLVETLWDRGVRASGVDISAYALAQARPDIRAYLGQGAATESLGGPFDLVTCIEVLEHLPLESIATAISRLTEATDTILFSSTPDDFAEPTHLSVRPPLAWIQDFACAGFIVDLTADPTFLAPHAIIFRRSPTPQSLEIQVLYSRLIRERVLAHHRFGAIEVYRGARDTMQNERDTTLRELETTVARLSGVEAERNMLHSELETLRAEVHETRADRDRALSFARETERRAVTLNERARVAEEAVETMEHALRDAVELLENDARATRAAVLETDRAVNRVVASPLWKIKRAFSRVRS